jgi:6-phosphofructokinase 2
MVLDTSGSALAAALEEGVYLVKPNLRELAELSGQALHSEDDWAAAAGNLVRSGKAQAVALTLGEHGALLVSHGMGLRANAIPVRIASTVGAGDSFLAAMVWRLAAGDSLVNAFRFGVAGGTAALLSPGTGLAQRDDTERLVGQVRLSAVSGVA